MDKNILSIKCPKCQESFKIKIKRIQELEEEITELRLRLERNSADMPDFFKSIFGGK